jgi:DnaJ-domain-containing protein 1
MSGLTLLGSRGRTNGDLERMKVAGDVKGLAKLSSDRDIEVSARSLKLLGDLLESSVVKEDQSAQAIAPVVAQLNSPVISVRAYAVRALYWFLVRFGVEDIYGSGGIGNMVALLKDQDPFIRKYGLYCLFEVVRGGHAEAVVYADGSKALGSLILSSEHEECSLALRLVDELARRDMGPDIIRSGLARALLLLTDRNDEVGKMAGGTLTKVFSPMGMVGLADIGRHLDETEHDAGVRDAEVESPTTNLDAYFIGGATGAPYRAQSSPPETLEGDQGKVGEFVMEENEMELDLSSDDDLEDLIYLTEERTIGTETMLSRLRDLRMFRDRQLISPEDYTAMKRELLTGLSNSVRLETIDCYAALQVPRDATTEMIKEAYRRLAHQYHPDKVEDMGPKIRELAMEEMTRLNHARETLLDPVRKLAHDAALSMRERGQD